MVAAAKVANLSVGPGLRHCANMGLALGENAAMFRASLKAQ